MNTKDFIRKIQNFSILSVPLWKIHMLKGMADLHWFDLDLQAQESKTTHLIIYWAKALLHNWNALISILKNEK